MTDRDKCSCVCHDPDASGHRGLSSGRSFCCPDAVLAEDRPEDQARLGEWIELGDGGVAPVVGSVLLLGLVVVMGAGSYTWVAGMDGPADPVTAQVSAGYAHNGTLGVVLEWSDSTLSPEWTRILIDSGTASASFGLTEPWQAGARFVPCLGDGDHSVRLVAGSQVLGDVTVRCYGVGGSSVDQQEEGSWGDDPARDGYEGCGGMYEVGDLIELVECSADGLQDL